VGPFGSPEAMRAEEDATMREAVTASGTGRPRPARARADDGQVAAGLVTCAVLALVALLVWFVVPVSAASDQHSRAQTAADAAALAAAEAIIRDADLTLSAMATEGQLHVFLQAVLGSEGATQYAALNNAHVVSYRYDWRNDRAEVVVETNDRLETGEASRARAVAEVGLTWGQCEWRVQTPPPPPPAGPGVVPEFLDCDHGKVVHYLLYTNGSVTMTPPGQFRRLLQARLVG
jgi:hypothetical protein